MTETPVGFLDRQLDAARMHVLIIGRSTELQTEIEPLLADYGVDWQLRFASDATAALLEMQRGSAPDVVVSELHPLGMDGPALLDRVREKVPRAGRLMVLDAAEAGQAMRALNSAHRLLHKPLQAEELIEAVDSLNDLQDLLNSDELRAAVGKLDRLPPPPKLYLALSRAVQNPDSSLADLAGLVAQDPVSAARVLRISNSAFYSSGREIADVRSAVIRLGQLEVRRVVLASEVFAGAADGVDREAMRQRSLLASQLAAKLVENANVELATTAALLAEVGMLLPGVRRQDDHGHWQGDGPHYAEAGAYLLGLWGLPFPIVEAVAFHRQPSRLKSRGFWIGAAVHVACALAAGREVDERFLDSVGVLGKLPMWRAWAQELGVAQQQAGSTAVQTPKTESDEARQARRIENARQLLDANPIISVEQAGVHYGLLAVDARAASAEQVEACLLVHRFDALAVDLDASATERGTVDAQRLQAEADAPWWRELASAECAASRLWAQFQLRLRQQTGDWPELAQYEAIELAHKQKWPIWSLDLDRHQRMQSALNTVSRWRRLRALHRAARAYRHEYTVSDSAWQRFENDAAIWVALTEFLPELAADMAIRQSRLQLMAAELRRRARLAAARRVLVVLAAGELAAFKRALRSRAIEG
ncbi:HDOD domain-containing protein [Pseudomarimonas arenosa]|uniref:HDOD domain-containing protein n=1 Tax=Pseudomarimonas arenosa TaxID=2774145 RepID=A0AAW3ZQZ8_9GAMM|nr:HDOD domain-containing protein [Pseudomarimonas arenosa]MBD8528143.1 HDOD domain-containing protein [Pseudomarimonas arenosa]